MHHSLCIQKCRPLVIPPLKKQFHRRKTYRNHWSIRQHRGHVVEHAQRLGLLGRAEVVSTGQLLAFKPGFYAPGNIVNIQSAFDFLDHHVSEYAASNQPVPDATAEDRIEYPYP